MQHAFFCIWLLLLTTLVSWGCRNKAPQTGRLETTEVCSLAAQEESLQLGCRQGRFLLEVLVEELPCAPLLVTVVAGVLGVSWFVAA